MNVMMVFVIREEKYFFRFPSKYSLYKIIGSYQTYVNILHNEEDKMTPATPIKLQKIIEKNIFKKAAIAIIYLVLM